MRLKVEDNKHQATNGYNAVHCGLLRPHYYYIKCVFDSVFVELILGRINFIIIDLVRIEFEGK